MSDVMEALHRDHRNLTQLLDWLEHELGQFDRGESPDYDLVQEIVDYCLDYPDMYHHPLEDAVLNQLRTRSPEVAAKVGDLHGYHRDLGALARRFNEAVAAVLQEEEVSREAFHRVAQEFLDAYRHHIEMEDSQFFPQAEATLNDDDWDVVKSNAGLGVDPLMTAECDGRFKRLRREIHDAQIAEA